MYADNLSQIVFVLFDDHIYDAWIDKARTMGLKPMTDDTNSQKENISNEPKAEATTDKPKESSDENGSKHLSSKNGTKPNKEKFDQKNTSNAHDPSSGQSDDSSVNAVKNPVDSKQENQENT